MDAKSSLQKTADILLPFVLYYGAGAITQMFLFLLLDLSMQNFNPSYRTYIVAHNGTIMGMIIGLDTLVGLAVIFRAARAEQIFPTRNTWHNLPKPRFRGNYIALALLAATAAVGLNGLLALSGIADYSAAYAEAVRRQLDLSFGVGLVVFGLISPIAEEILFRGIIYNRMKKHFPMLPSMLMSALLFGLYHGNIVQAIYGTVMGLLIVLIYRQYNNFAAPILFHSIANITVFTLTRPAKSFGAITGPAVCLASLAAAALLFVYIKCFFHKI